MDYGARYEAFQQIFSRKLDVMDREVPHLREALSRQERGLDERISQLFMHGRAPATRYVY